MKIEFDTNNAAFQDYGADEIARILARISEKVQYGFVEGKIIDINGNQIGEWSK